VLVGKLTQFEKTPFSDEAEIEAVVQEYAEQLFGSSTVYLSRARIATVGGRHTVPDAIVIDVERQEWFVVEAERASHGTWEHIAPQVSRQLAAVTSAHSRDLILRLALDTIAQDAGLKEMFSELGIETIEIHGRLQRILQKQPTVAIPIDAIPNDLQEWAQTLRHTVKIWILEKFVSVVDPNTVLDAIPDETVPSLTTTPTDSGGVSTVRGSASQVWAELLTNVPGLLGQSVFLEYGPRGSEKRTFQGIVRADGIEVSGKTYSPSHAAVYCMREAGSERRTANGWVMWRTEEGDLLTDLYERSKGRGESGTVA